MANTANNRPDIVEAISALARERDISEEMLISTVEEACKAAFRKSGRQHSGTPMNLSGVIERKKPVRVIARKTVVEEVEDDNIQISMEQAKAIRPDFQLGDIVEIDVTPEDFGYSAYVKLNAARSMMSMWRRKTRSSPPLFSVWMRIASMWSWALRKALWKRMNICPEKNTGKVITSRFTSCRYTAAAMIPSACRRSPA